MSANDYHFVTHWRVKGTLEEVFNIMSDTLDTRAGVLPFTFPSNKFTPVARIISAE